MPIALRFSITLVLSTVCLGVPACADFQVGLDAYDRGDYATALSELRPLAEQGDAEAQFKLGVLYHDGLGVTQNYIQAREWYTQAAVQGYAIAQIHLGVLYANGYGVPQDYVQTRQWYEKAAAQGNANAQYNLGVMHRNGKGVSQDNVQAHKWFNLSAANGDNEAATRRDALEKQMTPAQIAEAQKLAREWKPIK